MGIAEQRTRILRELALHMAWETLLVVFWQALQTESKKYYPSVMRQEDFNED